MNLLARIERLERIAPKEDRAARDAWLASLTDEELLRLIELKKKANCDLSVLTDAELDWLIAITETVTID